MPTCRLTAMRHFAAENRAEHDPGEALALARQAGLVSAAAFAKDVHDMFRASAAPR